MNTPNPALFLILGTTDEVTACDCCGKTGLKMTYAVQMLDSGDVLHYGSTCVCRNTGKPMRIVKAEINGVDAAKIESAKLEWERCPARVAAAGKVHEASSLGLPPGRQFADHSRAERAAASAAKCEIAARHGVDIWKLG